jgi:hypothetical protein
VTGEAGRRRKITGLGVEGHESVMQVMEQAWKLHKKHGDHGGVCWGPTMTEMHEARELVTERAFQSAQKKAREADAATSGDSATAEVEASSTSGAPTDAGTSVRGKRKRA